MNGFFILLSVILNEHNTGRIYGMVGSELKFHVNTARSRIGNTTVPTRVACQLSLQDYGHGLRLVRWWRNGRFAYQRTRIWF